MKIIYSKINFFIKISKILVQVSFFSFLWHFAKKRKIYLFINFIIDFCSEFTVVFLCQYIYKYIVNSVENKAIDLKEGLIAIMLYAITTNSSMIFKTIKYKIDFKSILYIMKNILVNLFSYSIKHSLRFFSSSLSGNLSNKLLNTAEYTRVAIEFITQSITNVFVFMYGFYIFCSFNIYLGIFFILWCFIYIFLLIRLLKKVSEKSKEKSEKRSKYFGKINDCFSNISNVKNFARENKEVKAIKMQSIEILKKDSDFLKAKANVDILKLIASIILFTVILGTSNFLLINKSINTGDYLFILVITSIFNYATNACTQDALEIFEAKGKVMDGLSTFIKPLEVVDLDNKTKFNPKEGKIVIENLSFSYNKLGSK